MDTGPIIAQAAVPVLPDDTPEALSARVLKAEHALYPTALNLVASGKARVENNKVFIIEGVTSDDVLFSPHT
jgi:folate-dependent phosphoribosylglycinamide formyltransferase PurN